jgi:hypothetical protein
MSGWETPRLAQIDSKEVIFFSGYGTKIPNDNTQIPTSNDQNISTTYSMSRCHFICFEF